jgi:hypothetical protein
LDQHLQVESVRETPEDLAGVISGEGPEVFGLIICGGETHSCPSLLAPVSERIGADAGCKFTEIVQYAIAVPGTKVLKINTPNISTIVYQVLIG